MFDQRSKSLSILVVVLHLVRLIDAYRSDCPEHADKILRASYVCKNSLSTIYICLHDTEKISLKEYCKKKPEDSPVGQKYVWTGGLRNVKCYEDRFQPFALNEKESSRCLYFKSDCNEEGQLIFDDKSTIQDRRCRCDHTKGYSFLNESKHHSCMPRTEDCSCVLKICEENEVLTPDYRCVPMPNLNGSTFIDTYNVSQTNLMEELNYIGELKSMEEMSYRKCAANALTVTLIVILSGFIIVIIVVFTKPEIFYEKTKGPEDSYLSGIRTSGNTISVFIGDDVLINCPFDASTIKTVEYWYRQGQGTLPKQLDIIRHPLKYNGGTKDNPSLHILKSEHADIGVYTCEVTQMTGTITSQETIVTVKDKGPVPCSDGKQIENSGQNTNVNSNTDLHIDTQLNREINKNEDNDLDKRPVPCSDSITIENSRQNTNVNSNTDQLTDTQLNYDIKKNEENDLGFERLPDNEKEIPTSCEAVLDNDCNNVVEQDGNTEIKMVDNKQKPKDISDEEMIDSTFSVLLFTWKDKNVTGSTCELFLSTVSNDDIVKIEWFFNNGTTETALCISENREKYSGGTPECRTFTINNLETCDSGIYKCEVSTLSEKWTSNDVTVNVIEPKIVANVHQSIEGTNLRTVIKCKVYNLSDPTELHFIFKNVNGSITKIEAEIGVQTESQTECSLLVRKSGEYTFVAKSLDATIYSKPFKVNLPDDDCFPDHLNSFSQTQESNEFTDAVSNSYTDSCPPSGQLIECPERTETREISEEEEESETQFKEEIRFRMVVSLDIGTIYSRYSFISTDTRKIDLSSVVSNFMPTCVLFSKEYVPSSDYCLQNKKESDVKYEFWDIVPPQKNDSKDCMKSPEKIKNKCDFLSFGTPTKQGCKSLNSVLQFERFKLELYRQENINDEIEVDDINGRKMKTLDVYSALIKALRSEVLAKIKETHNDFELNDITWVVTVPETCPGGGIDFIKLACQRGGIDSNKLMLESESSAVFKFYQYSGSIPAQIEDCSKYLIADLGGGTWDLIVYEVKEKKIIKRNPCFVSCRYGIVREGIMNQLRAVTGDRAMEIMEQEHKESYINLMEQFSNIGMSSENTFTVPIEILDKLCERFRLRSFAKAVDDYGWELTENNEDSSVDNITPENAHGSLHTGKRSSDLSKSDVPSNYQRNMEVVDAKLCISEKFIESLLKSVSAEIVTEMKYVLKQEKVNNVKTILLCGGYSSLSILQTEIKQAFKDKQILTLEDNVFCISKGALLCGIHKIK